MAGKWYESRTLQGTIIAGIFSIIVALILTLNRNTLPPLEIKSITSTGETVLATLALRPEEQLIDSVDFKSLDPQYLLLSES